VRRVLHCSDERERGRERVNKKKEAITRRKIRRRRAKQSTATLDIGKKAVQQESLLLLNIL